MKSLKFISLSLIAVLFISACSEKEASEKTLEIMEDSSIEMEEKKMMEEEKMMKEEKMEEKMMDEEEKEMTDEKMMEDEKTMEDEKMMEDEKAMNETAFSVETYTAARFAELKGNTPVVINFHATWCPVCRALDQKLADNMAQLPAGTVMLKADFDDEQELKKELGITQQTTLVFYNAAGEKVAQEYNPSIEKISKLLSS